MQCFVNKQHMFFYYREIRLWDMRKSFCKDNKDIMAKPVHVFPYPALKGRRKRGYSTMVLDSTFSRLFACCMDGVIYCFSCSNLRNKPSIYILSC